MIIKGASGFGDAIYLYPVVKWYVALNDKIQVVTNYPILFTRLKGIVTTVQERSTKADIKVSYCGRKHKPQTNQYEDVLLGAGIKEKLPFILDWKTKSDLKDKLNIKKKICVITAPYRPFGRDDGFGHELTIDYFKFQKLIDMNKDKYYFILIQGTHKLYKIRNINYIFSERDYIKTLDIYNIADMIIGQVGHTIPIAEALNKKAMIMYSQGGYNSDHPFITSITPQKIHSKKTTGYVIDSMDDDEIQGRFEELEKL